MAFLLIINGRSFLKDAIYSYFCSQFPNAEIFLCEAADKIADLTPDQVARLKLVLLHIGEQDADSPEIRANLEQIRTTLNGTPTVLLGESAKGDQCAAAIRAGAKGYIPETLPSEIIQHALPILAAGGIFAPPHIFAEVGGDADLGEKCKKFLTPAFSEPSTEWHGQFPKLTSREIEVLRLLAAGLPNKLIAHELSLKEGTVKVHMRNLMKKLKVSSRTQAALVASKHLHVEGNIK